MDSTDESGAEEELLQPGPFGVLSQSRNPVYEGLELTELARTKQCRSTGQTQAPAPRHLQKDGA